MLRFMPKSYAAIFRRFSATRPGTFAKSSEASAGQSKVSGDVGRLRLAVLVGHAVVADLGTGHRDDLSRIGRIGQHFLVASHARVEHDLAGGLAARARGDAAEPGSVFESKNGVLVTHDVST